jgi:glycosyltransferase involved in cell wall biosynthesis
MRPAAKLQSRSPYELDTASRRGDLLPGSTKIFFDGVLKGDYSLAIVNRYLARHLLKSGLDVTIHSPEPDWRQDAMLAGMPDLLARCASGYPAADEFDIHLRNTWPPKADDMVGKHLNAYVCFAWEEISVPRNIVDHFNDYLDLVMVTANFVKTALRKSGVTIPIEVVGNGTDHIFEFQPQPLPADLRRGPPARLLHVSSCFPRKGADRLVEAFCRKFRERDSVELVIKTFDNPHNTVEAQVEAALAANPGSAPIRVVKRSMTFPELVELIGSADALVAPSRGEGFGLPLAEALLLGTPVVTTGYSGQTDFCNDRTAWLVNYRMTPSDAHVSSATAQWADPDVDNLADQMARALSDSKASNDKVGRAQALLEEHFKWSDVARRVRQSLATAMAGARRPPASIEGPPIHIDLVSTWSQACGVATYSEHLFGTPALRPTLARVLAREFRGDEIESAASGTTPTSRPWGYETAGVNRLSALLVQGSVDVAWIQHHPGFFSTADMQTLARALDRSDYRLKVVTLHNAKDALVNQPQEWLGSFDLIFVHTEKDLALVDPRWAPNVSVIPHGILSPAESRHPDTGTFTIGTFGFLYEHKNVPMMVEALWLARRVDPRLRLMLLTCNRSDSASWMERARVEAAIEWLGVADSVEVDFRFLSDEDVADRLGGCDLMCFPYGDSSESATGAVRVALSLDRPLLCSRSGVLAEVMPCALVLTELNAQRLADAFLTLAANPTILGLRDDERRRLVARHAYPAIAERHLKAIRTRLAASH